MLYTQESIKVRDYRKVSGIISGSRYLTYAYGKKAERWFKIELILSQFQGNKLEKNKTYRKKVQEYLEEEKQI